MDIKNTDDPSIWQKIDAFIENEVKVQVNARQYAVKKERAPIDAWKYIGPEIS